MTDRDFATALRTWSRRLDGWHVQHYPGCWQEHVLCALGEAANRLEQADRKATTMQQLLTVAYVQIQERRIA